MNSKTGGGHVCVSFTIVLMTSGRLLQTNLNSQHPAYFLCTTSYSLCTPVSSWFRHVASSPGQFDGRFANPLSKNSGWTNEEMANEMKKIGEVGDLPIEDKWTGRVSPQCGALQHDDPGGTGCPPRVHRAMNQILVDSQTKRHTGTLCVRHSVGPTLQSQDHQGFDGKLTSYHTFAFKLHPNPCSNNNN